MKIKVILISMLFPVVVMAAVTVPWSRPSAGLITPLYTDVIGVQSAGTSTFSGGLYASLISSPYFHATSSSATSTFAGGILTSGAIGIGTTTPQSSLSISGFPPNIMLDHTDTTLVSGQDLGGMSWWSRDNSTSHGVIARIYGVSRGSSNLFGNIIFSTGSTPATLSDAMIITYNNRVGIGTTTPSFPLDVMGSIRAKGNGTNIIADETRTTGTAASFSVLSLRLSNDTTTTNLYSIGAVGTLNQGGTPTFSRGWLGQAYDDSAITWTGSNQVGIAFSSTATIDLAIGDSNTGFDQNAEDILDAKAGGNIVATFARTSAIPRMGIGSTSPWAKLAITNTSNIPSLIVEDETSPDASPFVVDASGGVGIGTSSPFAKLSVHAFSGQNNLALFAIGSSTASATTTLFEIENTGRVGIGTTSPISTLSVVGQMASSTFYLGSQNRPSCITWYSVPSGNPFREYISDAGSKVIEAGECLGY